MQTNAKKIPQQIRNTVMLWKNNDKRITQKCRKQGRDNYLAYPRNNAETQREAEAQRA